MSRHVGVMSWRLFVRWYLDLDRLLDLDLLMLVVMSSMSMSVSMSVAMDIASNTVVVDDEPAMVLVWS